MFIAFRQHKRNKGQSTLEYAVLIVVVIGALLTVRQYLQRGIMGRAKQAADDISDTQFDPTRTYQNRLTKTQSNTLEKAREGSTKTILLEKEVTTVEDNMWMQ